MLPMPALACIIVPIPKDKKQNFSLYIVFAKRKHQKMNPYASKKLKHDIEATIQSPNYLLLFQVTHLTFIYLFLV